ncbi:Phytochrome-like protein cph1 [compost metagenome]
MESIFHNLISNALKYKDGTRIPEIKIYTEIKNNCLFLHVKDNGLGIDLARHGDKIFGMHQVFHKHPNAKGIGLFMTKTQIESMDGKISVTSEVNVGTTFTVQFSAGK